jgi:dolichol-phosphate mannosyltransferase
VQVTVVIPTYNEAENLDKLVSALFTQPLPDLRLIIVDDNSPDGTGDLADRLSNNSGGRLSVLHRPSKLGLGTAYKTGFTAAIQAGAEAVGQMDADFSHPPELLPKLADALESCDVAMGSRYVSGGAVDERWPLWRKSLSSFGNLYARTILSLPVRDTTGGYRLWRSETLTGMPVSQVRSNGYAFQVEMTFIACRMGYTFREIPFYFADRRWGHSKMSLNIQREAAIRVWQMLYDYRHLKRP